jgi:hypothetical protein
MADFENVDNWTIRLLFKIPEEVKRREIKNGMSPVTYDEDSNFLYGCSSYGETLTNCIKNLDAYIKTLEESGRIITGDITITHQIIKKIILHSKEEYNKLKNQSTMSTTDNI